MLLVGSAGERFGFTGGAPVSFSCQLSLYNTTHLLGECREQHMTFIVISIMPVLEWCRYDSREWPLFMHWQQPRGLL